MEKKEAINIISEKVNKQIKLAEDNSNLIKGVMHIGYASSYLAHISQIVAYKINKEG